MKIYPHMKYKYVPTSGYTCWVVFSKNSIELEQTMFRAAFAYEDDAKWFCQHYNAALAQKVEPFILNECVQFDSGHAAPDFRGVA